MALKKVGQFKGIGFYEDPNLPDGVMYFLDERYGTVQGLIDGRTRWQKLKDKIKSILRRR